MEAITIEEAYAAMLCFIEDVLSRGNVDIEWLFLGYAAPLSDGKPADPAAPSDWLNAIQRMKSGAYKNIDLGLNRPSN